MVSGSTSLDTPGLRLVNCRVPSEGRSWHVTPVADLQLRLRLPRSRWRSSFSSQRPWLHQQVDDDVAADGDTFGNDAVLADQGKSGIENLGQAMLGVLSSPSPICTRRNYDILIDDTAVNDGTRLDNGVARMTLSRTMAPRRQRHRGR